MSVKFSTLPDRFEINSATIGSGSFIHFQLIDGAGADFSYSLAILYCDWVISKGGVKILDSEFSDRLDARDKITVLESRKFRSLTIGDDRVTIKLSENHKVLLKYRTDIYGYQSEIMILFRGEAVADKLVH